MLTYPVGTLNPNISGVPPVIEDGNTVAWYIADDLSTITKDGADLVSVWADKLGSGNDLLQAVTLDKPKWFLNDGILFDGIRQFMKTAGFTLNQPEQIYIVFKQITWTITRSIFDGFGSLGGLLQQFASFSPNLQVYAGAFSVDSPLLPLDTYGIVRVLFNGASSEFIINENTPITGNFGTNNMGGFTLGARGNNTLFANIEVKEILLRKIADSAQDEQDIYDYLAAKYSI